MNNSCTGCAAATGNKYYVDPMNGNDATATGSGMVGGVANPSCSFRTVTHALQVVGGFAVPGTQIIIVGQSGQTVPLDATEALPIIVPANVTIATQNGPIRVNLPASSDPNLGNVAGFQLGGDLAALAPDPGGAHHHRRRLEQPRASASACRPARASRASLSYVTVQNTGGHGIAVSNGTLAIGQGVTVTGAGTALKRRDGLNVAGGLGQHHGRPAGRRRRTFNNNTQHGIYVTGAGVINITGFPVTVPAPNGQGTVVANGNAFAGLRIFEAPGAAGAEHDQRPRRLAERAERPAALRRREGEGPEQRLPGQRPQRRLRDGVRRDRGGQRPVGASISAPCRTRGTTSCRRRSARCPTWRASASGMSPGRGLLTLSARGNVFAGPTDCTTSTAAHRALGGVRRLRRPGRRPGGGHDRHRRRRELPVATADAGTGAARDDAHGSAPAMIQARMRAMAAFGSHLRGGIVGRSRCSIFASSRLSFGVAARSRPGRCRRRA